MLLITTKKSLGTHFLVLANILILFFFIIVRYPSSLYFLIKEDSIIQWLQVFFYFISALIFFKRSQNVRSIAKLVTIALGLFCLFIFFEELAWGQRLFNYSFPLIQNINLENKIELHNMLSLRGNNWVYLFFALGILLLAPFIEHFLLKQKYGYFANTKIKYFYIELLPFYIFMIRFIKLNYMYIYFYEFTELLIAISFFFYAISPLSKYTKKIV